MSNSSSNFSDFCVSFLKFLLILALCVGASFAITFPFWLFAEKTPKAYSVFVLVILFALIILGVCLSFVKKYRGKSNAEKKVVTHNFLRSFSLFVLILLSLVVPFCLVLADFRILALIFFVLFVCLSVVVGCCVKKK